MSLAFQKGDRVMVWVNKPSGPERVSGLVDYLRPDGRIEVRLSEGGIDVSPARELESTPKQAEWNKVAADARKDLAEMQADAATGRVVELPKFTEDHKQIPAKVKRAKKISGPRTVRTYLALLTSELTQYDAKLCEGERKKGRTSNIYRLGHYLQATHGLEALSASLDLDTHEALSSLAAALCVAFTADRGEPDLAPVRKIYRQISAVLPCTREEDKFGDRIEVIRKEHGLPVSGEILPMEQQKVLDTYAARFPTCHCPDCR